jgi:endoglucanase/cellulose 1,4-beta-cellobiosidase
MPAVRPSSLRRFRLHLTIAAAAAAAAALTAALSMSGAGAAAPLAPADTPVPAPTTPAPGGSTPNTSPFPPGPPTDLTAQATTGSITLSWTASAPGCCAIAGYDIAYTRAFNDVVYGASVGDVTTATITSGISANSEYRFFVTAEDVTGRGSSSAMLSVMTPASGTGDTTAPPAPRNLNLSTGGGAQLSWTAPADTSDVAGYDVYGFDGWYTSRLLGTTAGAAATTFPAPGVSGPIPQYYVRSRDAAGNLSLASNTVRAPGSSSPPGPVSPSPTLPPSPSPSPSVDAVSCRVVYTSQSQWANGFVAGIGIVNTGQTTVNGWTLTYTFRGDQRITGSWGGTVSQSGATVAIRNSAWNAVIRPGRSGSVGVQGIWGTSNAPPDGFALNGVPCASG